MSSTSCDAREIGSAERTANQYTRWWWEPLNVDTRGGSLPERIDTDLQGNLHDEVLGVATGGEISGRVP